MSAAGAAQLEIHANPQDEPFPASTGVLLLQLQHIAHPYIHGSSSSPFITLLRCIIISHEAVGRKPHSRGLPSTQP